MNPIKPEIVSTDDGSSSLYRSDIDETYHSHHGALCESTHVYIQAGLEFLKSNGCLNPRVFELGFGTGLNAYLTVKYARENNATVLYHSIEKFPVDTQILRQLNYESLGKLNGYTASINRVIDAPWEEDIAIDSQLTIRKICDDFLTFSPRLDFYDAFYFDAFGFRAQEELWSETVFAKAFGMLRPGGVLVTYAAKGLVRRRMETVGFDVSRLPGAPGKREMLRAQKPAL